MAEAIALQDDAYSRLEEKLDNMVDLVDCQDRAINVLSDELEEMTECLLVVVNMAQSSYGSCDKKLS